MSQFGLTNDKQLEQDAAAALSYIGLDPTMTKASGQVRGDGDVHGGPFMIECKFKSTDGLSFTKKEYDKAQAQASRINKDLLMFRRNHLGQTIVAMDIDVFKRWFWEIFNKEENNL